MKHYYEKGIYPYKEKTVSAMIISPDGKMLIQDHVKLGAFSLPGGGVDQDETHEQAIVRELREELGINIKGSELAIVWERSEFFPSKQLTLSRYDHTMYILKDFVGEIINMEPKKHRSTKWYRLEDIYDLPKFSSGATMAITIGVQMKLLR